MTSGEKERSSCLFFHKLLFLSATRNECFNVNGIVIVYKVVDPGEREIMFKNRDP
jgi:hypothetical protein